MEAKLGFNGCRGYQMIFTKTVTASESQDSVVPDTMPDISSILCVSGCVLIRSKDVAEGHVRLEANVPARVCCSGEGEGQTFWLDVNIPFYISVEDAAIGDGSVCTAALTTRHLEAKMLNPRKITVRAEIEAALDCYAEYTEEFSTFPEDEESAVHAREEETELSVVSCVTEKSFVLTDEFELGPERSAVKEIIGQNADVMIQEVRGVGSKLIVKGSVRSELTCLCESGELDTVLFQTAFSQIIETQTETEDVLCETRIVKSGMFYEVSPVSDGRSISMELHLVAQTAVYMRRRFRYLSDAYSNAFALNLRLTQREIMLYERELLFRDTFTAAIDTAGEVGQVISCHASPIGWTAENGEAAVQLLVQLCWRLDGKIYSAERSISQQIAADADTEGIRVCDITVQEVYAMPGDGGVVLRITLETRAFAVRKATLNCISGIEYDDTQPLDLDDRPTLVILYPRVAGDLWTLAKENCSTVEAIRAANALSEDEIPEDRILLIPKTI